MHESTTGRCHTHVLPHLVCWGGWGRGEYFTMVGGERFKEIMISSMSISIGTEIPNLLILVVP